jgi:hypothetical protein
MTAQIQSHKRWWVLLPVLLLAAWLAMFGDKTPVQAPLPPGSSVSKRLPVNVMPSPQGQHANAISSEQSSMTLMELVPRKQLIQGTATSGKTPRDLFTDRSWTPAVRPVAALAPPPPMAPPVPFTYLGKRLDGQTWQVFLGRADQTFVVSAGSTIDNLYRVDAISPPNLSLTYLPLGQSQSLSIGETR